MAPWQALTVSSRRTSSCHTRCARCDAGQPVEPSATGANATRACHTAQPSTAALATDFAVSAAPSRPKMRDRPRAGLSRPRSGVIPRVLSRNCVCTSTASAPVAATRARPGKVASSRARPLSASAPATGRSSCVSMAVRVPVSPDASAGTTRASTIVTPPRLAAVTSSALSGTCPSSRARRSRASVGGSVRSSPFSAIYRPGRCAHASRTASSQVASKAAATRASMASPPRIWPGTAPDASCNLGTSRPSTPSAA